MKKYVVYMVQLENGEFINRDHLVNVTLPLNVTDDINRAKQWKNKSTAMNFIKKYGYIMSEHNQTPKIIQVHLTYEIKEEK